MSARRRLRRFGRDAKGATAVEFAIIAIPLLLMLFGAIEFGRMLWMRQSMSQVAVAAARCMGVPQSECAASGVRDATKSRTYAISVASRWGLTLGATNVTLDTAATCGGASGFSKVTLTNKFFTAVPQLIKQLAENPITVSACFPNGSS